MVLAKAEGKTAGDHGVCVMMFLLRMTFWLGVVCVLLPSGKSSAPTLSGVDTLQAVSAASATYSDMRGFCERQPDACAVGGQVASALGHRAQEGAKTIVEFISQQISEGAPHKPASQNTLTPADTAPAFSMPAAQAIPAAQVPLPPAAPRREAQNRRPTA